VSGDGQAAGDGTAIAYPFTVLTLFPEMIRQAVGHSIVGRGIAAGRLDVAAVDIRDYATDRHRTTDDVPYGGGPGMVMKPEPVAAAIRAAREARPGAIVVLTSASGRPFDQATARRWAANPGGLVIVCGHYEGVDERIADHFVDEEVGIGDYVLSGGELAALVLVDAVSRLVPGVLGNQASLADESHESGLVEYPQYTRPPAFEGHAVPAVLMSGNHAEVARFRRDAALAKTRRMRPDLGARVVEVVVERKREAPRPARLGRPRPGDEG
jgi:tRNA (guanine37-N1)-methyltransferase